MKCTLPLCQRNRKRAFLFQKSSLLAETVGLELKTKVMNSHNGRSRTPMAGINGSHTRMTLVRAMKNV